MKQARRFRRYDFAETLLTWQALVMPVAQLLERRAAGVCLASVRWTSSRAKGRAPAEVILLPNMDGRSFRTSNAEQPLQ